MSDHEPISIAEVKRRIGYRKGWRSLLNYLEAKELAGGVKFIARLRSRGRCRYRVTIAGVHAHAPELIKGALQSQPSIQLKQVKEFLASIDGRITFECEEQITKRVTPRISALQTELSDIRQRVGI